MIYSVMLCYDLLCYDMLCCVKLCYVNLCYVHDVGPCHHGMARPRFADGGMASYMKGSCE